MEKIAKKRLKKRLAKVKENDENEKKYVKLVIFYTDILMRKVVLWCFFMSETSEKNPQLNFLSQNPSIECNFFK